MWQERVRRLLLEPADDPALVVLSEAPIALRAPGCPAPA
jgi:hypothetical protein